MWGKLSTVNRDKRGINMNISGINLSKAHDRTMMGTLESNEGSVQVESMRFSAGALKKIANTIENGSVRRENQEFVIESICINVEDRELFEKGQSAIVKVKNGYALTADCRRNPKRFMGRFQTVAPKAVDDGYLYACEIIIGSIEFDLENSVVDEYDSVVEYENVPAMIYPCGRYTAHILEDE